MNNEVGSEGGVPIFPRKGEAWFECFICGFDFPLSESRRHYKTKRLVDAACDDEKTHVDHLSEMALPREAQVNVEQPVSCQGEAVDDAWYGGVWYEAYWYGEGHRCEGEEPS